MFFLGIYFLLSALFLPNITAMIQSPMDAITIASADSVSIAIIVILAIMAIGGIISKKYTNFR
jgi:predicted transporter